ncbi:MAG TPA: hypothetical protein EYO76_05550 [Flavobacteriaceae bacterium]|nr:hypothetical protein [Flavobacteriaceae bacterium]
MSGNFILSFDLSPRADNGIVPHAHLDGAIDFKAVFKTALPESITVMFYGIFENNIQVGKNDSVMLDYQV